MSGARWVQSEILERHPDAKLEVYAVWFNMLWTDSRWLWRKGWLDDPRVVHFWDQERLAGRFYDENVTHRGASIEWDAFFVYAPGARWGDTPPDVVTWGRPIRDEKERLRGALRQVSNEG